MVEHVEISDVSANESSQAATDRSWITAETTTDSTTATAVTTDTSYASDSSNINISAVTTGRRDSTVTYYVADVVLREATTLQSAFAEDSFGGNITETTSAIAEENNAVFSVNGDYCGFRTQAL